MFKKAVSFLVLFFVLFSNQALAHTSLIDSTPKDGTVVSDSLEEVTLYFGTKVEESSTITVSQSDGQSVYLDKLSIVDDEMTATFLQPLSNGVYEVKWDIIGADGHPMEGHLTFTVNVPVTEQAPEEEQTKSTQEPVTEVDAEEQVTTEEVTEPNEWPSYMIPAIIGVLAIIVIGSFVWMLKRKRKS